MIEINKLSLKEKLLLLCRAFISVFDDEYGKVTFFSNNDNDEVLIMIGKNIYKLEKLEFDYNSLDVWYKKDDKCEYKSFYAYRSIDVQETLKNYFPDIIKKD